MNSSYDVVLATPKLYRRGTLVLKGTPPQLSATFDDGEGLVLAAPVTCEGTDITLSGEVDAPSGGTVACDMAGSIWGNSFSLKGTTGIGEVNVYGTRLSASAGDFSSNNDPYYAGTWSDAG